MKKVISTTISIICVPIILAGFLWEIAVESWDTGREISQALARRLHSRG